MDFSGIELVYVGGKSDTVYIDLDCMCYFKLKHSVGIGFVEYKFVEGNWYFEPNKSMDEGLHEVRNDNDVTDGVYEYGADNEDGTIGDKEDDPVGDPFEAHTPPENSVGLEFTHLLDDDLRTTDDEFEDALFTIGVRMTKRRVAYMTYSSGEEVEQFVLGKKFRSPALFKHAVVNHAIHVGANLIWLRRAPTINDPSTISRSLCPLLPSTITAIASLPNIALSSAKVASSRREPYEAATASTSSSSIHRDIVGLKLYAVRSQSPTTGVSVNSLSRFSLKDLCLDEPRLDICD
ncbi:hypothetical protein LINPERPRIM_LOCUS16832 [Linum perenne]